MKGKKLLSLSIVLVALSLMIYSCGSSDSERIKTSEIALHEHAFKDDSNLYAQFSHVTVLEFEHSQESNVHEKDSGSPGVDVIPYIVRQGRNHTFQLEDVGNEIYYTILRNENEEEVARIDANGTPVTVSLLPGKYKLYIYNIGTETFPLFLQPETPDVGSSRQASYNWFSLQWFKLWFTCVSCDLSHANLSWTIWNNIWTGGGVNLSKANLSYANLEGVQMENANLSHANLSNANLNLADLDGSDFSYADLTGAGGNGAFMPYTSFYKATLSHVYFSGADMSNSSLWEANLSYAKLSNANLTHANINDSNLSHAYLTGSDLTLADLTGADLSNADLSYANLFGADLTNANLTGAWLREATWIDGRTCAQWSIGSCEQ
jgi:uncharacterized protein YjbI with pentapeptide repeats